MEQTGVTYTHKHSGIEGCAFCSFNFHKMFQNKPIHAQMYSMISLTFVVKMGSIVSQELTNLAKEI